MLAEVLEVLAPGPGKRIVDATVGAGGHAEAILGALGSDGELVVIDRDPEMLELAAKRLSPLGSRVRFIHARLSQLEPSLADAGVAAVDGVLLDLGLCSAQLDDPTRGFRFQDFEGTVPLDMRMDRSSGESAAQLLERLDEEGLCEVLREGGVPRARAVARAIRSRLPIRTARRLADAVGGVRLPPRSHHPATLVFQALRIAVNEEYRELEAGLEQALDVLAPGGRLVVLSYHSGEDRRVKGFLAREARGCICPPDLPVCGCGRTPRVRVLARGEGPSQEEVARNPRARSARLRAGERR
jgi:16S rRNA (cytosine1402-N4)-methyltransferase